MAWTFVCPTEIIAFSDRAAEFAARGAAVAFASTDSEYSLLAWCNASRKDGGLGEIKIPLLSDKNQKLSRAYGVLIEEEGIALRGLFLIDPRGVVRQITINDLPVGRSVDETLRLIDAFQFTEKYGEVSSPPPPHPPLPHHYHSTNTNPRSAPPTGTPAQPLSKPLQMATRPITRRPTAMPP